MAAEDINESDQTKDLTEYRKGDEINGSIIETIYGQSAYIIIYRTKSNSILSSARYSLKYSTARKDEIPLYAEKCAYFLHLFTKIPSDLPKRLHEKVINQLAVTFYGSMSPKNEVDPAEYFKNIEAKINDVLQYSQNIRYRLLIFLSFLLMLVSWIIICLYPECCGPSDPRIVTVAIPAGILGAFLSILQRKSNISMSRFIGWKQILLASFSSLITGAIAGAVTYLLIESKLILGNTSLSDKAYFIICFLSGGSERYFNSLLNKASDGMETPSKTNKEGDDKDDNQGNKNPGK